MRKEVFLKDIKPHPELKKFTEQFSRQKKILQDPGIFTAEAALLIGKLLPITAIQKGKSYLCISGYVGYCLLAQTCDPAVKIEIEVIKRPPVTKLNQYICGDLLLLPIVAALTKSEIGERYDVLMNNLDCNFGDLFAVSRQKDICKALGCSRNTLFKHTYREDEGINHE